MTIIYSWKNNVNGKRYIGQTKHPEQRRRNHIHEAMEKDSDYYFHRALRKYGEDSFTYEVLDELGDGPEQTFVDFMENHYIHDFDTIWPNGYNQMYAKSLNETAIEKMKETKRKQFDAMTPEERRSRVECMVQANTGAKRTEETKKKMSESAKKYLAENPRVMSEETKRKIAESVSKRRKEKFWSSKKGGE
jgi:group I intron endonuclease